MSWMSSGLVGLRGRPRKKGVLALSTHIPLSSVLNKKNSFKLCKHLIFPRQDKVSMLPRATAAEAGFSYCIDKLDAVSASQIAQVPS